MLDGYLALFGNGVTSTPLQWTVAVRSEHHLNIEQPCRDSPSSNSNASIYFFPARTRLGAHDVARTCATALVSYVCMETTEFHPASAATPINIPIAPRTPGDRPGNFRDWFRHGSASLGPLPCDSLMPSCSAEVEELPATMISSPNIQFAYADTSLSAIHAE